MANHLITGMPGNGKTLFALKHIENRRIKDNADFAKKYKETGDEKYNIVREVYYHDINMTDVLPWKKLEDHTKWAELPVGSIVVFDECHKTFPLRGSASRPPAYVEKTAQSRHNGYDLYFITQNPKNYDSFVRGITEHHYHVSRPFGAPISNISLYKTVNEQCYKSSKGIVSDTKFPHPKEVFTWYKSAEVHTHKFKMPLKYYVLLLFPLGIAASAYYIYDYFQKRIHPPESAKIVKQTDQQKMDSITGQKTASKDAPSFDPAFFKPRFDDIPWSAPRYDELTQPTVAPVIVGCMIYQAKCKCMTQQGTYYATTMQFCKVAVENGIFQDFPANKDGARSSGDNNQSTNNSEPNAAKRIAIADKPFQNGTQTSSNSASELRQDSGFNLPIKPPAQQYAQQHQTQPSGSIYVKGLPDSKVLLGNH